MKQVIEEVLQAEERVGALLKEARAEADQVRRAVEHDISRMLNESRSQAQILMQTSLEEAKMDAEQIKEDRLKQADQAKETLLNDNADKVSGLVKEICDLIMSTDSD